MRMNFRHAENVMVLYDPVIAQQYGQEWDRLWLSRRRRRCGIDGLALALHQQNYTTHGQKSPCQWAIGNIVWGFLGGVDRPHVQNLILRCETECAPNHYR